MKICSRRRAIVGASLAAMAASTTAFAQSSSFPDKPLRLMVGYAAGGGLDTMARILAQGLSAELKQPVVVENRTGAAGMVAAHAIAKSPADGYSLLMGESGLLVAPHLQPKALVDPLLDLTPVAGLFESQLMIVANNDFPASNPKELLAVLKANPGKYSYATSGIGTIHHLAFESMKARAGVFILHIPYRGASQLIPDLVNNQIQLGVVSAAAGRELTNAGRIRAVAMLTASEQSRKGTVLPVADVLPGFNVVPRHVLYAPAGIPAEAADRLAKAIKTVLAQPSIIAQVTQQGVAPAYRDPAELKPELIRQSKEWAALIKTQNIKPD